MKSEKNPLILIVDDVPKNLQVLGSILKQTGKYQIAFAMNGTQALKIINDIIPDLILLDIMMPEMDGYEVCRQVKASPKIKDIPIIFLTAKTEVDDIVKGFELGAVDYVTKPFNATELLARVTTHVELKQARDIQKSLIAALTKANTRLRKANYQLRERQNLIVKLLGDISKIRLSGDRHAIRNFAQRVFENQKNSLIHSIRRQLELLYQFLKSDATQLNHFVDICQPFGIRRDLFDEPQELETQLHQVVIDKSNGANLQTNGEKTDADGAVDDFFSCLFSHDIFLDDAYHQFQQALNRCPSPNLTSVICHLDPFSLFFSIRAIRDIIDEINQRFANHGEMGFLDKVRLSDAVNTAKRQAISEKERPFQLVDHLGYDPVFSTNRDALVYMIRDLFYNAIDAGADMVRMISRRPCREKALPHYNRYNFEDFPSLYICVEDNGGGIPDDTANRLNAFLEGADIRQQDLSTKKNGKGGLGTRNLRDFLFLHKGRCFYESVGDKTRVHMYIERLEI